MALVRERREVREPNVVKFRRELPGELFIAAASLFAVIVKGLVVRLCDPKPFGLFRRGVIGIGDLAGAGLRVVCCRVLSMCLFGRVCLRVHLCACTKLCFCPLCFSSLPLLLHNHVFNLFPSLSTCSSLSLFARARHLVAFVSRRERCLCCIRDAVGTRNTFNVRSTEVKPLEVFPDWWSFDGDHYSGDHKRMNGSSAIRNGGHGNSGHGTTFGVLDVFMGNLLSVPSVKGSSRILSLMFFGSLLSTV